MSYSDFITLKIDVAHKIAGGAAGGGYTESGMILAALSSGISADIWPGEGFDRKRFVELWVSYAAPHLEVLKISVPLLAQELRAQSDHATAASIEAERPGMFGPGFSSRVLIGPEVDMSETDIIRLAPTLKLSTIRSFSYAALFYKHVRCGLAHEFHLSESATWNPMSSRNAHVSYSNRRSASLPHGSRRLIYFDLVWVAQIIKSVVSSFGADGAIQLQPPARWWIEG